MAPAHGATLGETHAALLAAGELQIDCPPLPSVLRAPASYEGAADTMYTGEAKH